MLREDIRSIFKIFHRYSRLPQSFESHFIALKYYSVLNFKNIIIFDEFQERTNKKEIVMNFRELIQLLKNQK